MKPAVLVVSFGATHLDTLERNIAKTEGEIAAAFPGHPMYRAFTSRIVRRRLKEELDISVDAVEEALSRIAGDGHRRVVIQPTFLIPGGEYDRLKRSAEAAKGELELHMGQPLLYDDNSLDEMIAILREAYPVEGDTVLLAMGHGAHHAANHLYERLADKLRGQVEPCMALATVEGTPSFSDAVAALSALPQRRVHLIPLLLAAGTHAKNDMAGDGPGSLCSLLEKEGFRVTCSLRGLGELAAVRQMYVRRALEGAAAFSHDRT